MQPMKQHDHFGPVLLDDGWVPAPRYLLRRDLVLKLLSAEQPGTLLEVGSGPAALLYELYQDGWSCTALEQSSAAREIAHRLHTESGAAEVLSQPTEGWSDHFDWVLAMEVLEHIEDDLAALQQWFHWLRPGGSLLLTVPAHMSKWNRSDEWAGHFRRYERKSLVRLFERAGFTVEFVYSYGFPLANIIEPLRAWHKTRKQGSTPVSIRERTEQSGVNRSAEVRMFRWYSGFAGVTVIRIATWMQSLFIRTDLGNGYLVRARRS
jgi:SAM-dependent methyltransferase